MKKEKIIALDFLRTICAVGIVFFHISCYAGEGASTLFLSYANGEYGTALVGIFLLISGTVLYYNYQQIPSLKTFYYRRWKTMYPAFYLAWAGFAAALCLVNRGSVWSAPAYKFVLTLLGLDGYFNYLGPTFYLVGEWFFGAIVILYILYPVLMKAVNRFGWMVLLVLLPLWIWQDNTTVFRVPAECNLIYCALRFSLGMLIAKYRLYKNKYLLYISIPVTLALLIVPIPYLPGIQQLCLVFFAFFALFVLGQLLMKIAILEKIFHFLGDLSFFVFLLQNNIGSFLTVRIKPVSALEIFAVASITVVLCFIGAFILKWVLNWIFKTKLYQKLENRIVG